MDVKPPDPSEKRETKPFETQGGRPRIGSPTPGRFLGLGGGFLVALSSLIAFVATCAPIGLFGNNGPMEISLVIGCVMGAVVAIVVGFFVWKLIF